MASHVEFLVWGVPLSVCSTQVIHPVMAHGNRVAQPPSAVEGQRSTAKTQAGAPVPQGPRWHSFSGTLPDNQAIALQAHFQITRCTGIGRRTKCPRSSHVQAFGEFPCFASQRAMAFCAEPLPAEDLYIVSEHRTNFQ